MKINVALIRLQMADAYMRAAAGVLEDTDTRDSDGADAIVAAELVQHAVNSLGSVLKSWPPNAEEPAP